MNRMLAHGSIVLIGPMAVGKSTIGAKLARLAGREFLDSDQLFEEKYGPIPAAFDAYGEPWFRQMEARIVATVLARQDQYVLSLGGGAVLDTGTQQLLGQSAVVFLEADAEAVRERILRCANRPLLRSSDQDPMRRWNQLSTAREPVYRRLADLTLDVGEGSPEAIAAKLMTLLENQPGKEVQ